MNEGLFDSKTNKQIIIGVVLSLLLILICIAVEIFTSRSVFEYCALGVAKLFGDSSVAAYRNTKVDGPIRQEYARLDIAQKAHDTNVDVETVLKTWKPTG